MAGKNVTIVAAMRMLGKYTINTRDFVWVELGNKRLIKPKVLHIIIMSIAGAERPREPVNTMHISPFVW